MNTSPLLRMGPVAVPVPNTAGAANDALAGSGHCLARTSTGTRRQGHETPHLILPPRRCLPPILLSLCAATAGLVLAAGPALSWTCTDTVIGNDTASLCSDAYTATLTYQNAEWGSLNGAYVLENGPLEIEIRVRVRAGKSGTPNEPETVSVIPPAGYVVQPESADIEDGETFHFIIMRPAS